MYLYHCVSDISETSQASTGDISITTALSSVSDDDLNILLNGNLHVPVPDLIVSLLLCLTDVSETSQVSSFGMFEVPFYLLVLIIALVLLTVSCISWPFVCFQCLFLKHMRHIDVEPRNVPMTQSIV